MAQASSAAREPSMEEILASIRRIIEDSDVTRQVSAEEAPVEKPIMRNEQPVRGEVAPFRRPAAEVSEPVVSAPPRNFERPLLQEKVADTSASHSEPVRNSVISAVSAALENPDAPVFDTNINLRGSFDAEETHAEYVAVKPVPANDAAVAVDSLQEPDEQADPALVSQSAVQSSLEAESADFNIREKVEESVENDIQKIISEMMEKQPEEQEKPSAALASDATKQQVAASFDQLSEAVRQERIRSLEEQAEALLRPMLQNWLDENLPSMVERLVREEIERMVRGEQL
ncbi:DUF2497 domain-containing protein [Paenochrobactrum sp. BZR 588]|uniref:PopZ family protein n=1 Tax=Paenochrobactrum TaxID=999488 RepID=UPI0035BBB6C6